MTNEEKILAILEKHSEMLEAMQSDIAGVKERLEVVDERSQRTAILLETEIVRKLDLLYEGHGTIMESLDQLAPISRVERLESDMDVVKDAVKHLRKDVNDLKRAQ